MNKKRFKKMIAVVLTVMLAIAVSACGSKADDTTSGTTQVKEINLTTEAETDISATETEADTSTADTTEAVSSENADAQETHVLVAYFSATHTTEGVAKTLADVTGADLYEITPEEPYTDADLDYNDNNSRTTKEMNDPSARPAIAGTVENMDQYDIVFIGYPIWWGDAPRIMSTFVESYDLSGKTIVPFCTSASSSIGSSAAGLAALTSGADWLDGQRFGGGASADDISSWVNGLGLDIN